MTYREDFTLPAELLEQVQEQGLDVLPELIRTIINHAMLAEREQHLHAEPYQRNQNVTAMPMGISRRRCEREWARSRLRCHKCEKVGSTRKRWKRDCGANEP